MSAAAHPDRDLVAEIRAALAAAGDPARALGQQAYMKSSMPYCGVRMAPLRQLTKAAIAAHPPADRATWEATVRTLWDGATYREERYAAVVLAGHRCARDWQDRDLVPLYRHLIVTGAWWDHVDSVATVLVGPLLRAHRADLDPQIRAWAVDDDLWLRRTAVICQVGAGGAVDLALLADCVVPNLARPEFWLRKACGWALRDAARVNPEWVRAFVTAHDDQLSRLTRAEATKHLSASPNRTSD